MSERRQSKRNIKKHTKTSKQSSSALEVPQENVPDCSVAHYNAGSESLMPPEQLISFQSPQKLHKIPLSETEYTDDEKINKTPLISTADTKRRKITPYSDILGDPAFDFQNSEAGKKLSATSKMSIGDLLSNSQKESANDNAMIEEIPLNTKASITSKSSFKVSRNLRYDHSPNLSVDKDIENKDNFSQRKEKPLNFETPIKSVNSGLMFATATGKDLNINPLKLKKVQELFSQEGSNNSSKSTPKIITDTGEGEAQLNNRIEEETPRFKPSKGGEFSPGMKQNNRQLDNQKSMIDENTLDFGNVINRNSANKSIATKNEGFGFITAGGKNLLIDSSRLESSKKLFEFSQSQEVTPYDEKSTTANEESLFSTSNKIFRATPNVHSNNNQIADKKKLKFVDELVEESPGAISFNKPRENQSGLHNFSEPLFSTASGRGLAIDQKKIESTSKLFQESQELSSSSKSHGAVSSTADDKNSNATFTKPMATVDSNNPNQKAFHSKWKNSSNPQGAKPKIDPKRFEALISFLEGSDSLSSDHSNNNSGKPIVYSKSMISTSNKSIDNKIKQDVPFSINTGQIPGDSTKKSMSNNSSNQPFMFTSGGGKNLQANSSMLEKSKKLFEMSQEDEEGEELMAHASRFRVQSNQNSRPERAFKTLENSNRIVPLHLKVANFVPPAKPFGNKGILDSENKLEIEEVSNPALEKLKPINSRFKNQIVIRKDHLKKAEKFFEMKNDKNSSFFFGDVGRTGSSTESPRMLPAKKMRTNNNQTLSFNPKSGKEAYKMGNSYTKAAFSESGGKLNSFGGIKRNYEELQRGSSLNLKPKPPKVKELPPPGFKQKEREGFLENPKVRKYLERKELSKKSQVLYTPTCYNNTKKRKDLVDSNAPSNVLGFENFNANDFKIPCHCVKQRPVSASKRTLNDHPSNECDCNGSLEIFKEKLREILINEGLRPDYMSQEWFDNHFRMIIWKLISKARYFAKGESCLNFQTIKAELEYRYFIENFEARRSIIKRIFEKDAAITSHMVLLVGEIKTHYEVEGQMFYIVELSDGWYSLYAEVKHEINPARIPAAQASNNTLITKLITQKKLAPGVKIEVSGLLYKNKTGPPASNPLDVLEPDSFVELSFNSIVRARWNAKLGEVPTKVVRKNLKSLRQNGGFVSAIDVFVERKYPLMERTQAGLRQITPSSLEEDSEGINGRKGLSFRLKLRDALHLYTETDDNSDPYVEIEISHWTREWYEKINEGDRVVFCNLKATPPYNKNFSYFDFKTFSPKTNCIFLQTTNQSVMQTFSELKLPKGKFLEIKEHGKCIASPNLVPQEVEVPSTMEEEGFYAELWRLRNDIDVQGVVVECAGANLLGVLSTESFFIVEIFNKSYLTNLKLPLSKGSIVAFKNCQLISRAYVELEESKEELFVLRTNDYSVFLPSSAVDKYAKKELESINVEEFLERGKEVLAHAKKRAIPDKTF